MEYAVRFMDFSEKNVLITGVNGGIGSAIKEAFLHCGANIIGIGMKEEATGEGYAYYQCDVRDTRRCEETMSAIIEKYEHIDALVNCAGITNDALTGRMTEEQFDDVVKVNLKGVWNVTKVIGKHMQKNGSGSIVNISSVVGVYGNIGQANYAATKAGVIGLTKTWAKEFAYKNGKVRVNAVAPGYTETDMLRTVPQNLLEQFAASTLLGRLAKPEEIASAVLFLASEMASYITGTVLQVDAGMRL